MTTYADILPPHPDGDDLFCLDELIDRGPVPDRAIRADGWTPAKQRLFLRMVAEGHTITNICAAIGMSVASAYALRRAARGAAFALGWQAALLLAREHLADTLLERAVHGSVETITRSDGSTLTRQRHDNRLAVHMLARLDRLAETGTGPADHAAARLVAGEFEQFLELVEREGGAARAGLFLARRLGAEGDAAADDLAPVRALARADAWLRTGSAAAAGVPVADLDPAQRAGWTAEQWARAEAAGLLALAPPPAPENAHDPQLPQLWEPDNPHGDPVWWSTTFAEWRTSFPPDALFYGDEDGEYGDEGYSRALSPEELEGIEGPRRAALEVKRAEAAKERDTFFADEIEVVETDDVEAPREVRDDAACAPAPPDSSHPETAAPAPGLTPPAAKPISRSGRTSGAAKRQRIREGTMPSNDQSRPTAPVRAAALI